MSKENQFFAFSNEILKLNECYFLYNQFYKFYIKNFDNRLFESSLSLLLYPLIIILCNFYQNIEKISTKNKVQDRNYIRIYNILNLIDDNNIRMKIVKKIDAKVIKEVEKLFYYRNRELAHIDKEYIQNNFKDTITLQIIKDIDFEMLVNLLNEIFDLITVNKYDKNYYNESDSLGLNQDFEDLMKIFNSAMRLRNSEYKNLLKEKTNISKGFIRYEIKNKYF
ncbi:MAG: hypothetical protein ACRDA0_01695 [Cetobacterium sp.]|uniref:hypothetical protein n=1 Tax=Cetobacterium sp. TaxID=2071632 RepID=UPI003F3970C9